MSDNDYADIIELVYNRVLNAVIVESALRVHRMNTYGLGRLVDRNTGISGPKIGAEESPSSSESSYGRNMLIQAGPDIDIFGRPINSALPDTVECPECHRRLGALRFAPHLEKCMGMGRQSSRVASRRNAQLAASERIASRKATSAAAQADSASVSGVAANRLWPAYEVETEESSRSADGDDWNDGDGDDEDDVIDDGSDSDWNDRSNARKRERRRNGNALHMGGIRKAARRSKTKSKTARLPIAQPPVVQEGSATDAWLAKSFDSSLAGVNTAGESDGDNDRQDATSAETTDRFAYGSTEEDDSSQEAYGPQPSTATVREEDDREIDEGVSSV